MKVAELYKSEKERPYQEGFIETYEEMIGGEIESVEE